MVAISLSGSGEGPGWSNPPGLLDTDFLSFLRGTSTLKSTGQAQRFLSVEAQVHNLFRLGRHLMRATHYRILRARSFAIWNVVTCV